jgi:hypothetical protein
LHTLRRSATPLLLQSGACDILQVRQRLETTAVYRHTGEAEIGEWSAKASTDIGARHRLTAKKIPRRGNRFRCANCPSLHRRYRTAGYHAMRFPLPLAPPAMYLHRLRPPLAGMREPCDASRSSVSVPYPFSQGDTR